jgi:hypothetical protein
MSFRQSALVRVLVLLVATTLLGGSCGDCGIDCDASERRYSATDLERGVAVDVDDGDDLIDSATVFLPDDLPSYLSVHPTLAENGVAVLQPGEGGYDVVVVYRTGPYCGLLPKVSVNGAGTQIRIHIRSRSSGDCDDMQYDEAVGFQVVTGHETDHVVASVG